MRKEAVSEDEVLETLTRNIMATTDSGFLGAIIGPPGTGKSTLVNTVATKLGKEPVSTFFVDLETIRQAETVGTIFDPYRSTDVAGRDHENGIIRWLCYHTFLSGPPNKPASNLDALMNKKAVLILDHFELANVHPEGINYSRFRDNLSELIHEYEARVLLVAHDGPGCKLGLCKRDLSWSPGSTLTDIVPHPYFVDFTNAYATEDSSSPDPVPASNLETQVEESLFPREVRPERVTSLKDQRIKVDVPPEYKGALERINGRYALLHESYFPPSDEKNNLIAYLAAQQGIITGRYSRDEINDLYTPPSPKPKTVPFQ